MNDLDNDLARTMRRHAENLSAAPLAFDDVRGKATSIRRRRQLAAGVGALAAVAVIVPTAMFASQSLNADSEPPVANQTPTVVDSNGPTPTDGPSQGVDAEDLDVRDLPTGAPPQVPLVTGGDAARAETAEAVVRWTQQGIVVEAGGQTFGPYAASTGFVRNEAATTVAWATDEGDLMAWADGGSEPFVIGHSDLTGPSISAISGTSCAPGTPSDCLFYASGWNMQTNTSESFTMTPDGQVGEVARGAIVNVNDVTDDGRLVGLTELRDDGSCSAVFAPGETEPVFRTCDHTLEAFSPNGDLVLASEPYHSGIGSGTIAIYDAATGDLLAERTKTKNRHAFYNSAVWEDESHVLFTAYQDGQWSIVRMGLDGAMEYAMAPQKGEDVTVPWHFETR